MKMEKISDKQLKRELPFDLYGRYALIRDIINNNRGVGTKFKVLDVGGRGNLLRRFLPDDDVFYLDPFVDSKDDNFIKSDGCNMSLEDSGFDWVVSADVFEHIPREKRDDFLNENIRVAKLGTVLAAPFDSIEVRQAEINANENYKKFSGGKDHKWLKEHIENGLPKENEIEEFLKNKGFSFQKLHNNRLFLWETLLGINFFIGNNFIENLGTDLAEFNYFYNTEVFPYDSMEPSYRKIYFIKKDNSLKDIKTLNKSIDDSLFLDAIKKEIDLVARIDVENKNILDSKNQEIQSRNQEIQSKEQLIQLKNQEIQSKEQLIQLKNQEIQSKEQLIQLKNQEILFMKSSKFWKMREFNFKIKFVALHPLKFAKKYSKKLSYLYGEVADSFWHEGPRRMISRTFNYLLHGKGVLNKTEILNRERFSKEAIHKDTIKKTVTNALPLKTVYFVSNIPNGGSRKYIDDLIDTFKTPHVNFIQIKNRDDLKTYKNTFKKDDVLMFQYLYYSDLTFQDITDVKKKYGIKLVIPVHDFYFLQKKPSDFYQCHTGVYTSRKDESPLSPAVLKFLKTADLIIYPSEFVKDIFDSVFVFQNAKLSRHIDFKIYDFLQIPKIGKTINIGIINNMTVYKGADYYAKLFSIKNHKGYNIKYHAFGMNEPESSDVVYHGPYAEEEIFSLLKKNSIHGLAFFNKWGETYSYSLTKGINTGLPILYSNIGAYTERLRGDKKFFPIDNIQNIEPEMHKMLDMIISKNNSSVHEKIDLAKKDVPDLYADLFSVDYNALLNDQFSKNKKIYDALFNIVEPYAIYFPQFHALKENSRTFYEGYHDMINLEQAKKADPSIETPLKNYLGYYNLKNDSGIIEKQILLAKANGFKGFGVYYYWFSHNSVTGNNMLMKDVIDKFFRKDMDDFDVFFIYANESWSENPAFNQHSNEYIIKNEYSKKDIIKNFENLLPYFKHKNYKKVDNKPVLFVHHPWEMTKAEFDLFHSLGDEMMKQNGFSGLELAVNGMQDNYEGCKNYAHHPNYKNTNTFMSIEDGTRYIDYKKYVDDYLPNMPFRSRDMQTVFYNFDNSVRFFNHKNKQILVTKTINNNIEYFKKFLSSQLASYCSPDKVGKIFLVNSWNEWGEQMSLEPSSESGFALLDVFNETVLEFVKKEEGSNTSMRPFIPSSTANAPFIFGKELGEKEIVVIIHLFYPDMWEEVKKKLVDIPYNYTLIVSLTEGKHSDKDIRKIKKFKPGVKILTFENKGMDILPFLKCLKHVPATTKYLLKIHTKKSHERSTEIGKKWFGNLIDHVLRDKKTVDMILQNLEYSDVGMIGGSAVPGFEYAGIFDSAKYYEPKIEVVYKYFETSHTEYEWIAGSMFWVRFDIINKFNDKFIDYFEENQPAGYFNHSTIAHGLERYFGKLVYDAGKVISPNPIQRYSRDYITFFPEKNIMPAKKDIYLFFHICCIGDYEEIVRELVDSLEKSGLYGKSKKVFYTTLGKLSDKFLKWLGTFSKFECIHQSSDIKEVEYPTLAYLQDFCKEHDAYVMYFHTKGVSNSYDPNKIIWRKYLTQKTINEYRNCVSFLNKGCDVAGCGWKEHPYHQSVVTDYDTWTHSHFSGNFWWAQSAHIRSLPDIRQAKVNYKKIGTPIDITQSDFDIFRILCEMWIGMKKNIKIGVNGNLNREYKRTFRIS
jgi:hypothetical protein